MSPEHDTADRDPERPEGTETVWRVADRSAWRVGPDTGRTVVRPAAGEPGGRIVVTNGEWAAE